MNVYDSGRMADVLAPLGYAPAEAPDAADMVILNTCHIREKASEKLFSELGRLRALKREREAAGGRMVLAVAGCVAQAEGAEITARAPWVDIVLGPQTYHRLPEMVARASRAAGAVIETDFPAEAEVRPPAGSGRRAAGRDRLPHRAGGLRQVLLLLRGALYPRRRVLPPRRRRAGRGAAAGGAGAREITLLGQNVNAYHGEAPAAAADLGPRAAAARAGRDPRPRCGCATPPATRATWTTS